LLLAATVRRFAHMPLGLSDRNSCHACAIQDRNLAQQNTSWEKPVIIA